jgi:hypothetical protein
MPSRYGRDLRASLFDDGEWQTPSQSFRAVKLFYFCSQKNSVYYHNSDAVILPTA